MTTQKQQNEWNTEDKLDNALNSIPLALLTIVGMIAPAFTVYAYVLGWLAA